MTIVAVTGDPGVGKTTAVIRAAQALKERGLKVGGIVSRDLRGGNMRIGFEFIDLTTNDRDVLASINGDGPKVGKYFVNLAGCRFAVERLTNAIKNSDVVICDELGPMEFKSKEFIDCVRNLLELDKTVIVVVHKRLQHVLINELKKKTNVFMNIDLENRDKAHQILLDSLLLER
jgi:nucleoside-triphosphatase